MIINVLVNGKESDFIRFEFNFLTFTEQSLIFNEGFMELVDQFHQLKEISTIYVLLLKVLK